MRVPLKAASVCLSICLSTSHAQAQGASGQSSASKVTPAPAEKTPEGATSHRFGVDLLPAQRAVAFSARLGQRLWLLPGFGYSSGLVGRRFFLSADARFEILPALRTTPTLTATFARGFGSGTNVGGTQTSLGIGLRHRFNHRLAFFGDVRIEHHQEAPAWISVSPDLSRRLEDRTRGRVNVGLAVGFK